MHIHFYRDIPLALGIIAFLIALLRPGSAFSPCASPDPNNPEWGCRAVLNFVGVVLLCFAVLGNFTPR